MIPQLGPLGPGYIFNDLGLVLPISLNVSYNWTITWGSSCVKSGNHSDSVITLPNCGFHDIDITIQTINTTHYHYDMVASTSASAATTVTLVNDVDAVGICDSVSWDAALFSECTHTHAHAHGHAHTHSHMSYTWIYVVCMGVLSMGLLWCMLGSQIHRVRESHSLHSLHSLSVGRVGRVGRVFHLVPVDPPDSDGVRDDAREEYAGIFTDDE